MKHYQELSTPPTGPNGLDFHGKDVKEELYKALTKFETKDLAKSHFAESMGSDLHEEWRKDNRFHKWSEKEFIIGETLIKVDGVEYAFNGTKEDRGEFIITEAGKENAQKLGKDYESSIRYDYAPRMKKSKDQARTQAHGTDDVDIANTKFEDLPSNWKYENLEAAKVAIELVFDYVIFGKEVTNEMIEEMADTVHEKWLERNPWEKDGKLGVPYNQLPEEEKEKDRAQIRQAIAKIKSGM